MNKIKAGHYKNEYGEVKKTKFPFEGWIIKPKDKDSFLEYNLFDTKKMAKKALYSVVTGESVMY